MSEFKGVCFVIMPFTAELHYFYLYLKQHLETAHRLQCERADDADTDADIFTETIRTKIQKADLIIADCTGCNANVMYEVGMAHAYNRKVILITQDDPKTIPSDLKHYTFILYELRKHIAFLDELNHRLEHFFGDAELLYQQAVALCAEFEQATGIALKKVDAHQFAQTVRNHQLPAADDKFGFAFVILPIISANSSDPHVHKSIFNWISTTYPPTS